MTTPDQIAEAMEHLLEEITACREWQRDLEEETARALRRQRALASSISNLIDIVPQGRRAALVERLTKATGTPLPSRAVGNAKPTGRTE